MSELHASSDRLDRIERILEQTAVESERRAKAFDESLQTLTRMFIDAEQRSEAARAEFDKRMAISDKRMAEFDKRMAVLQDLFQDVMSLSLVNATTLNKHERRIQDLEGGSAAA